MKPISEQIKNKPVIGWLLFFATIIVVFLVVEVVEACCFFFSCWLLRVLLLLHWVSEVVQFHGGGALHVSVVLDVHERLVLHSLVLEVVVPQDLGEEPGDVFWHFMVEATVSRSCCFSIRYCQNGPNGQAKSDFS